MRVDPYSGEKVPSTLGEYRDVVAGIFGENNKAVLYLDDKIKEQGRDEEVVAADSQVRAMLIPMAMEKV